MAEPETDAPQGLSRTVEGVTGSSVPHLFPTDSVLLVTESQDSVGDTMNVVLVIQGRRGATMDAAIDGEVDVLEVEWSGSSVLLSGGAIFTGSKEEEEGHNREVHDVGIEGSPGRVESVERFEETLEDGEVARVGTGGRIVFIGQGFEESSVYGMEVFRVGQLSGIRLTQVGDPLADGSEGLTHCASADRVVGRSGLSVLDAIDEEEAELCFLARDITEGWVFLE